MDAFLAELRFFYHKLLARGYPGKLVLDEQQRAIANILRPHAHRQGLHIENIFLKAQFSSSLNFVLLRQLLRRHLPVLQDAFSCDIGNAYTVQPSIFRHLYSATWISGSRAEVRPGAAAA